jgi:ribosome biogenesis GTPase
MIQEGLVIKSVGSLCTLLLEDQTEIQATLRGKFRLSNLKTTNPVAVGDRVDVLYDPKDQNGIITAIHDRKNYIIRKSTNLSHQAQIIASNIDQAVLTVTVAEPRTSMGFMDRFIATAEAYEIPVLIVFNKIDLLEHKKLLKNYIETYSSIGYPYICTSIYTHEGISKLKKALTGKINLFSGHSGVGKSSLVNAINPNFNLKVGEISDVHLKGKHTTTFAELHTIFENTYSIDTPGIKEFGMVNMEADELKNYFIEFKNYESECKFSNCSHKNEPHCGIKTAVQDGKIALSRYQNYLNISETK